MRRIALAAIATLLAAPAWAQGGPCADVGIVATGTGTQRVPRMGPGSDLLTQSATLHNAGAQAMRVTLTLVHRAFQQDFVAGQVMELPAGARREVMLGNVLRPGLDLAGVRGGVRLSCLPG